MTQKTLRIFVLTVLTACGSDSDGDGKADPSVDAGTRKDGGESNDSAASAGACTGCSSAEGCVSLAVSVQSSSADLPWKQFSGESEGSGRLFAGLYGSALQTKTEFKDDVNLKSAFSGHTFHLCYPAGSASAFCFLDDRGDGMLAEPSGLLRGSSNYRDTCSNQRAIPVTVRAGATASVECVLSASCD